MILHAGKCTEFTMNFTIILYLELRYYLNDLTQNMYASAHMFHKTFLITHTSILEHMGLDNNIPRNNDCNYDGGQNEPKDKVEPGILIGENIKKRWKPAVKFVKCSNCSFLTGCHTPSKVIFFLVGIVVFLTHFDMKSLNS